MDAFTFKCVQICGQHAGEGFAFTGAHFGNVAEVQCCATHNLYSVVLLAEHTPRCFAGRCECFEEDFVEAFTASDAFFELGCFCLELLIGQVGELFFKRDNLVSDLVKSLHGTAFADAEHLGQSKHEQSSL